MLKLKKIRSTAAVTAATAGAVTALTMLTSPAAHAGYASHTVSSTTLASCNQNGRSYAATWGRPVNGYNAVWFEGCRYNPTLRRYTGTVHFSY